MAKPTSRSSDHHRMAFHAVGLFVLSMLVQSSNATEYKVGGANGWTVPADSRAMTLNQWAEMKRFQTGDSLLFVYQADKDSVLQVTQDNYNKCNTASYIASFNDGNTSFKFNRSGPYYFISGIEDRCQKNEKLIVVVMAERNNTSSNTNQTSLAPSPSPSPSGSPEVIPFSPVVVEPQSPSPDVYFPPRPNGAPLNAVGLMGSVGILLGSSILFNL
ncbi:early nodulin-like protein 9 isoform X2 [Magnolia sinica]|uniref:early nodulin-like protein 9 isoform X2 n=1 Tax=Magnolia sinica TaxID=86752 RepID=UPI00265AE74E|nr:early nodulin-like protein 9 isoform X2 [Magnolia sinica]